MKKSSIAAIVFNYDSRHIYIATAERLPTIVIQLLFYDAPCGGPLIARFSLNFSCVYGAEKYFHNIVFRDCCSTVAIVVVTTLLLK